MDNGLDMKTDEMYRCSLDPIRRATPAMVMQARSNHIVILETNTATRATVSKSI
jgi:hypothetical protein